MIHDLGGALAARGDCASERGRAIREKISFENAQGGAAVERGERKRARASLGAVVHGAAGIDLGLHPGTQRVALRPLRVDKGRRRALALALLLDGNFPESLAEIERRGGAANLWLRRAGAGERRAGEPGVHMACGAYRSATGGRTPERELPREQPGGFQHRREQVQAPWWR